MNKNRTSALLAVFAVALALTAAAEARDFHGQAQVTLAPMGRAHRPPPLGRKQGWLTISNRDWQPYSLVVSGKDTLSLYRAGEGYGGMVIPSGASVTIALEKETYDLYGNNPDKLKVKVREGRTTTLSLEPFGYVGSTGVMGVVNDGDKVRNGTLFDVYTAPVVIAPPPQTIIVERPAPPPPPPVIISRPPAHRPPVVVVPSPGPSHRPSPGRPGHGGGRPGGHGGKNDGWGFTFSFGNRK